MESSTVSTQGISVEKLSISWLQLFGAIFALGGAAYTLTSLYADTVNIKAEQKQFLDKYVPVITTLSLEANHTRTVTDSLLASNTQLVTTLNDLNNTLISITVQRTKEDEERKETKATIGKINDRLTQIEISLSRLER